MLVTTADMQSNAIAVILVRNTIDFDIPVKEVSSPETNDIISIRDTKDAARSPSAVPLTVLTSDDISFINSLETETISSLEASDRNNPYFLLNLPVLTMVAEVTNHLAL